MLALPAKHPAMTLFLAQTTAPTIVPSIVPSIVPTVAPAIVPDNGTAATLMAMAGTYSLVAGGFLLLGLVINFVIVKRSGYNPWLSLLALIPLVNFVMILIFAFREWPVQHENRELRTRLGIGKGPIVPS